MKVHMPKSSQKSAGANKYLLTIRNSSNYPTFRAFVSFMTLLMFGLSVLIVVVAIASGQINVIGASLIGAACLAIISKVVSEVSLMIADIADSTIYTAAHQLMPQSQSLDTGESSELSESGVPNYEKPMMTNEQENNLPISEKLKRWW